MIPIDTCFVEMKYKYDRKSSSIDLISSPKSTPTNSAYFCAGLERHMTSGTEWYPFS